MNQWNTCITQAKNLQNQLRAKVIKTDQYSDIRHVAGIDLGYDLNNKRCRAAIAVLNFPALETVETTLIHAPIEFPYIPGYLSFREVPAALQAYEQLSIKPDMIICDGHGYAHPRRFGLACHLGVTLDIPTIGAAKSRFIGEYSEPGIEKGSLTALIHQGEQIGVVLRSRRSVQPIYVSIGHRISLASAVKLVQQCVTRYRLPETTRVAHHLASHEKLLRRNPEKDQ